jgi:hypothetical protein
MFEKHKTEGIPHSTFAYYLLQSGLVLNRKNHWITFHGGMDFGYLLKLLLNSELPSSYDEFRNQLDTYFINYYDCKEIKKEITSPSGGLKQLARDMGVERVGTMHQAGSDAQVTLEVYFKLRSKLKQVWCIDSDLKLEEKIKGKIYGIQDIVFNEDQYIDQYKYEAKMIQYRDDTGCVNRRKILMGQTNQSISQTQSQTLHSQQTQHNLMARSSSNYNDNQSEQMSQQNSRMSLQNNQQYAQQSLQQQNQSSASFGYGGLMGNQVEGGMSMNGQNQGYMPG